MTPARRHAEANAPQDGPSETNRRGMTPERARELGAVLLTPRTDDDYAARESAHQEMMVGALVNLAIIAEALTK
jgi:hypothetical protein